MDLTAIRMRDSAKADAYKEAEEDRRVLLGYVDELEAKLKKAEKSAKAKK